MGNIHNSNNTEKSLGDERILAVTKTLVKRSKTNSDVKKKKTQKK